MTLALVLTALFWLFVVAGLISWAVSGVALAVLLHRAIRDKRDES